jgi:peptide/nickel transport system substrate-binding protein
MRKVLLFCFLFLSCKVRGIELKDFLKTSTISDPKTFNIVVADETSSTEAVGSLFESLLRRNYYTLDFEPGLTESYDFSEDGLRWHFKLREGLLWSDGKPLTAYDVKFTIDLIYSPDISTSLKDILTIDGKRVEVRVIDERNLEFILPKRFAPFLASVGMLSILPSHILKKPYEEKKFEAFWNINTPPSSIIGSGPYKMVEYVPGQFIRYEKNQNYYLKDEKGERLPYIPNRLLLIVSDTNTQFIKFRSGEIDIYYPRTEEIPEIKRNEDKMGIKIKKLGVSTGVEFFAFNLNPKRYEGKKDSYKLKWFSRRDFRMAIAMSIDKNHMIRAALGGIGEPAISYASPEEKDFYNSSLVDYEFNPQKAKEILSSMGFKDVNNDGWIEDPEGNRVEFDLFTNSGNKERESICTIFVEDMKKIGIKVNFKPIEFNTLVEKLLSNFEWDVVLIGLTGTMEPHNGANFLRSSGKLHLWNPMQKKPATEWEAEIDSLIEKGAEELDRKKRAYYYRKIQEIIHREIPIIPTVRRDIYIAWKENLENFHPTIWGIYKDEWIRFRR